MGDRCRSCGLESVVITISDRPRDIDACIAPIVRALNEAGIQTVASCCGHDHRPSAISLADGREVRIMATFDEGQAVDRQWPLDIHGVDKVGDLIRQRDEACDRLQHYQALVSGIARGFREIVTADRMRGDDA